MELYLLKSATCLAIFFLFYKLLLENSSLHRLKRWYLLAALFGSFGIPLIRITTYIKASELSNPTIIQSFSEGLEMGQFPILTYLPAFLWSVYLLGVLFFGIRFAKNLLSLFLKIKRNQKLKYYSFINVLLRDAVTPHTFFNYIFLNKARFEAQEIPTEVLLHEQTHAKEKHSFDILCVELFRLLFWFNPLIYAIKHSIKLNHEFLADKAVLNQGINATSYQNLLLSFSSNAPENNLANAIHYSFIKKRFKVMKTQTSKNGTWLRSLLLLPLLGILLYGFSSKEIIERDDSSEKMQADILIQKATDKQLGEYNALAKKYNSMDQDNMFIEKKDVKRLKELYGLMSETQRKNAEPFPKFPPPPPAPTAPTAPKSPNPVKENIKTVKAVEAAPPQPPKAPSPTSENSWTMENVPSPPPPPPPPNAESPIDHIVSMAKADATFYYEGNQISSDKAIALIKANPNLNIQTKMYKDKSPVVKISTKGITVDE